MTGGADQLRRFIPALSPDTFGVDEATVPDLLSMTRDYAATLSFLDDQGRPQGHWGELFDRDESALVARALSLPLDRRARRFLDDVAASRRPDLAEALVDLSVWLDEWLDALRRLEDPAAVALAERAAAVAERALVREMALTPGLGPVDISDGVANDLEAWLAPILERRPRAAIAGEAGPSVRDMRTVYFALIRAIGNARASVEPDFGPSQETRAHEPATALLIALLRTFQRIQARINRFTRRRLDFYYREVLGLTPNGAEPDSVNLVFLRDPTFLGDVIVPSGQDFTAGRSLTGQTVVFRSQAPLTVTDAQVRALKTLRLGRQQTIWPERGFRFVNGARVAEFAVDIGPENVLERDCAPLMGGEVLGAVARETDAAIGLAVSAPILWLEQGERTIDLTLEFDVFSRRSNALRGEVRQPPEARPEQLAIMEALQWAAQNGADAQAYFDALDGCLRRWLGARPAAPARSRERLLTAMRNVPQGLFGAIERMARDWLGVWSLNREALLCAVESAADQEAFFQALGRVFACWLMSDQAVLTPYDIARLRRANRADPRNPFIEERYLDPQPDDGDEDGAPILMDGDRGIRSMPVSADFENDPLVMMLRDVSALREVGDFFLPVSPEAMALGQKALDERRLLVREDLFSNAFKVEISTALGWFEIPNPRPREKSAAGSTIFGAMTLSLGLTNEDPAATACLPAIHGPLWSTEAPALRLTLTEQARIYPFSLFDNTWLTAVSLKVAVNGLRRLTAQNQLGQLDPGKPFPPFGPLPDTTSYLVVGAPEAARKAVTAYTLDMAWAGLPPDGFSQYYGGYGDLNLTDTAFKVRTSILRDGRWMEVGSESPLFSVANDTAQPIQSIAISQSGLRAYWRMTDTPAPFDQNARGGFVKLRLSAPDAGFGHQQYPLALADAMRARIRRKESATLPNPPYTPMLERLTLDYTAVTRIDIGASPTPGDALAALERVFHIHPFGVEQIHPSPWRRPWSVLPYFGPDGHLFIGLSASDLKGPLTLLFELREDTATERESRNPSRRLIEWSWLADDLWRPLERNRLLGDTTLGFQTTGIVTLDLPAGLATGNHVLPNDLFWLRVSSDAPSEAFAGLQGVHAQALRVRRVLGEPPAAPLPPQTITAKSASIPGVLTFRQPAGGFGLRRAETDRQEWTRVSERLRHKMRASTPWDYERLVLEKFPSVYKVKCLPNLMVDASDTEQVQPGAVLVVVAPRAPRNDSLYSTRALQLNALELNAIEAFLPGHASPQARIRVRNATYEYIQVRCRIAADPRAQFGDVLGRVNKALVAYLSPWHDGGYDAKFGWTVRGDDIEACVRAVAGVRSVGAISLIHILEEGADPGGARYHYADTARQSDIDPLTGMRLPVVAQAQRPWSLALPIDQHIIEIMPAEEDGDRPEATGLAPRGDIGELISISGLEIGATFVLGQEVSDGVGIQP